MTDTLRGTVFTGDSRSQQPLGDGESILSSPRHLTGERAIRLEDGRGISLLGLEIPAAKVAANIEHLWRARFSTIE